MDYLNYYLDYYYLNKRGPIGAETIDASINVSLDACMNELRSFVYSLTMPDPKMLWKYAKERYSLVVAWENEDKAYSTQEIERTYRDREYENQNNILIHRLYINQCADVEKKTVQFREGTGGSRERTR